MVRQPESVSFLGLGYVGLCTATVMASRGIRIVGVDVDEKRIEELRKGHPPFHEPQLQQMLKTAVRKKRMECTTDASCVSDSSTVFLSVGTPCKDDGSIDLTYVKNATQDVGSAIAVLRTYHPLVVTSQV